MKCPNCQFPVIPLGATNCPSCGWAKGTPVTPPATVMPVPLSAPSTLHKIVADTTRSAAERNAAQQEINERDV